MSFDAGGRVGVRSAKQIRNNLFAQRRTTKKEGGTIPLGLLEDRFDITEFDEDNDRMDKYMRKSAMYNGPDSIFLEQDLPRRNAATNAGLLNLRLNGSLGKVADQNHSEMFIGFDPSDRYFGKDPRGGNEIPDHTIIADHMWMRGKQYIKAMPVDRQEDILIDTDNIYRPIKIKNDLFYPLKDRARIFSTSLDGRENPKMKEHATNTHQLNLQDASIDLQSSQLEDMYRAPDYTTFKSNQYMTDFGMSVTDHRIPVAKYGDTRTAPHLTTLDLYSSRQNNQLSEHRVKDEMDKYNKNYHNVADPRLIAGIATRLALSDNRTKDSADNNGVTSITPLSTTKDIDRFVTEYTSVKTGSYIEHDTKGIYNPVSYEGNSIGDMLSKTTPDNRVKRQTSDVRDRFISDNRHQVNINNTALSLLQVADMKRGVDLSNEKSIGMNKLNRMVILSAVNGAVSAAQNTQTGQSKKYSGMSSDSMSTVSYKDAKVVGNVSKLDELNDMGDIDNYESINTQAVRAGNRDPVYSKTRDATIIPYDYKTRTDNSGDDGTYTSNNKRSIKGKRPSTNHIELTQKDSRTMIGKEFLTPSKKNNRSMKNISNSINKLSVRESPSVSST
jgi:hypothetical protein